MQLGNDSSPVQVFQLKIEVIITYSRLNRQNISTGHNHINETKTNLPFICKTQASHVVICFKVVKPNLRGFVDHFKIELLFPNLEK